MPRKTRPSSSNDLSARIVDAALRLASRGEWADISLAHVAREAGLTVAEAHDVHPSKAAILEAFSRRIDAEMAGGDPAEILEGGAPAATDVSVRERLFDVLMRRFDALQPHKAALRTIVRDAGGDPVAALSGLPSFLRSMALALEVAGLPSDGLRGALRVQGLAAVYAYVFRTWLNDDSPDMARTMAALDKALRRAETFTGLTRSRRGRWRGAGMDRAGTGGAEPEPLPE